jgi:hypothetical protein
VAKPNGYPDDGSVPFWSGWPGTPDPSGSGLVPYPWEHGPVPGSGMQYPWENNPNAASWADWNAQHGGQNAPQNAPAGTPGSGTQPFLPAAMKWLGALALLWIVLTALTEYSPNTRQIGVGLAGLILFGALYYLGPTAMANIQHLWE